MMFIKDTIAIASAGLIGLCMGSVFVPSIVRADESGALKPSHLTHLKWRNIGPAFISGRIADIEAVESDPDIVYVATSVGGLWKSTDRGSTLKPVFENGGTASLGLGGHRAVEPEPAVAGIGGDVELAERFVG